MKNKLIDIDVDGDVVSIVDNKNFETKKKHYINVLEQFLGGKQK